jgi:hypothetical protein
MVMAKDSEHVGNGSVTQIDMHSTQGSVYLIFPGDTTRRGNTNFTDINLQALFMGKTFEDAICQSKWIDLGLSTSANAS